MYQKERTEQILQILKEEGYVTVKYLTEKLHYSNATINRDLNYLQKLNLVKRSYGGVEPIVQHAFKLPFRRHKERASKKKLSKIASELVKDGDVLFIDASTTCEYMFDYLLEKKDLTIITNNLALAIKFSENGVDVCCLGGNIVESPCMLDGIDTIENAKRHKVDKMFFSSGTFTKDGEICMGNVFFELYKVMQANAKEVYFLVDKVKYGREFKPMYVVFDFSKVKGVITDYEFSKEVKEKFNETLFINI